MLNTAGTSLSNNGSCYGNDRFSSACESELASDLASSGFINSECKKYDDLKLMLDSNKDGLKLEAMKRIIGMIAKGRDASDLFPSVVKNVVSKNIEVKKLVYVYLVRYAEDQQDLALLSISTFQRALKDPNQLIRASALRVLSSIRVPMIVPIVMLAIKDSASDMSPYVRKTAAHAIPKLFSLDPEQKEELVAVLEKLLSDKTTLVVGSAAMAFEEVCPERIDLIHKCYRKLCNLLVDIDEWGQIIVVNVLTRYARSQFLNPNQDDQEDEVDDSRPFYDSESDVSVLKKSKVCLDSDQKLLLRNSKPLLQSRNAAVVMAVAQLYYHAAPRAESQSAAKALIRLLRSHREVQVVVLHNIASISITRKGMFEPFLKSFFVRTSDPTHVKLLKIEIMTCLANETNINIVLREFQTYISSSDKQFAAASIQAIGLCASNIDRVADTCLNGLVALLSNRDEAIVAESVVVIKKLLQTQPNEHKEIIAHMAKLMDFIAVPQARASILWLLGEYSCRVPKIAPDVLRKMAKTFVNEQDIVKLQTLNLAVKLYLINPEQILKFAEYVFQLAKYDQNYDIRDRARFLKFFISSKDNCDINLSNCAKKIFLATKPAPLLTPRSMNTEFQLGTLSHYLNMPCKNYKALPSFPEVQPDTSVREVPEASSCSIVKVSSLQKKEKKIKESVEYFYEGVESTGDLGTESSSDTQTSVDSSEEDQDTDDLSDTSKEDEDVDETKRSDTVCSSEASDTENSSDSVSSCDEDSDSKNYSEEVPNPSDITATSKKKLENCKVKVGARTNLDLLLDLDEVVPMTPVMTPSLGGFLSPISSVTSVHSNDIKEVPASFIPTKKYELLNKVSSKGFHLEYRFTRSQHLASTALVNIEFLFQNSSSETIYNIHIGNKSLSNGVSVYEFSPISNLLPNSSLPCSVGINFNDSTQPVHFCIDYIIKEEEISRKIEIKAPIGEIIRSVAMPESMFTSEKDKLKGMNEHAALIMYSGSIQEAQTKILKAANLAVLSNVDDSIKFAAYTVTSKSLVLVTVKKFKNDIDICVNCEKMVIGSMLLNELKNCLK